MTLSRSPLRRTVCRYCGVETHTGANHSCERECLDALATEVMKARRLLAEARQPNVDKLGGLSRARD